MNITGLKRWIVSGVLAASCMSCHASAQLNFSKKEVEDACRKAADWQLSHPGGSPMGDWVQGPFLNGLFAISQVPGNGRYLNAIIEIGEKNQWGVIKTIHEANDHCTPQTWLDVYRIKKNPRMLEPTRRALDEYILAAKTMDDNLDFVAAGSKKWTWCDALYMSPPAFARMYAITGDQKYLDYLNTWWWKVSDYYYDTDEHLYYRDQKFFKQREPNGRKVFWSRGNGWVVGGLVRVLQVLDEDDPMRPKYVAQFKEMCAKIAEIQCEEGLWRGGLLDPVAHTQPETSGSAFFVYAMAYGVNEGILDSDRFGPVIEKAWNALCSYVTPDGRFTGVQPVGEGAGRYNPKTSMPYGVGAFLLAGSEVYKLVAGPDVKGEVKKPALKTDGKGTLKVSMPDDVSPRIKYAVEQVKAIFDAFSLKGSLQVSVQGMDGADQLKPEGFRLTSDGANIKVIGADQSGVLYGCLEMADRIRAAKAMPADIDLTDAPEFKLRGTALAMQKLGGEYLHPYTPEKFPFFYDKAYWREYLDFLVSIRMNSVYLWNGHPFASLVQLEDYPEALEVSPDVLKKNREMMYWLTSECDKRGIWLIQMFYNIHLPEALGLGTSLSRPEPKAADYTRKSIAKFVEEYPNVGLLVCLGEALSGKENQVEWFTKTIIPGMLDGLNARGQTELPPIVVRGHHIVESGSHEAVLSEGKKLYPNLFSMAKFNGESLTSETPRGKYQQYHKDMAKYSGTHIANVHLMSNLEPFRYADFSFIWNSAKAIRDRLDGNGLHLYPMNYWDWPNTPDKAEITQIERDRLWFEIWARYAWKLDRDPAGEREYWIGQIAETYGTKEAAEKIYEAYDAFGECAPRILRRFGITGGNRQCMSLGMFLEQLTDPKKSGVWQELYDSDSPLGETITQYIDNEFSKKPHVGETPPQIVAEVRAFASKAVEQIDAAAPYVTESKEEFERLRNDVRCVEAMSKSYCAKVEAAMMVLRYRKTEDGACMKKALHLLEESLNHYKTLAALTKDTYNYANGMHGRQRVPKAGVYHWTQLVGDYEKELADFRTKVADLEKGQVAEEGWRAKRDTIKAWPAADFKLLTPGAETYKVEKGAKVFTDRDYVLKDIAPHLVGLTGMRFSHGNAKRGGIIKMDFEVSEPVKVLVGYFDSEDKMWLQVPALEHVAHANDRGGIDPVLEDVAEIGDSTLNLPKVNVHAFRYEAGRNTLEMIGTGSYVILGVVPAGADIASNKN